MRYNGTIRIETRTAGSTNEYGEPIAAQTVWGEPIRCCITANSDTRLGKYENGEFHQASYTVLLPRIEFEAERVMLAHGQKSLGEYRVISAEELPSVGRIKIIV